MECDLKPFKAIQRVRPPPGKGILKTLAECCQTRLSDRIILSRIYKHPDPPRAVGLLGTERDRTRSSDGNSRAAEPHHEFAPSHGWSPIDGLGSA
jgi:hypothetical protein